MSNSSDSNDEVDQTRPVSPLGNPQVVSIRATQQSVERHTMTKPGFVMIDSCIILKPDGFENAFKKFFTEEKLRIYLNERYNSEIVVTMYTAIRASPIFGISVVKEKDKKDTIIDKISKYAIITRTVVNQVKVLNSWFFDILLFFSERGEYLVELQTDNCNWVRHWSTKKVDFALYSSVDPRVLKSLLNRNGNFSSVFDKIWSQSCIGNFESFSTYEKLKSQLIKRYDGHLFLSVHPKDLSAAQEADFQVFYCGDEDSNFPRLSKLANLNFIGK